MQSFTIQTVILRFAFFICFRYTLPITLENKQSEKDISMAEPIFLNPNSYDNIKLILDQLKVILDIGGKREWSYVGCDGPLYVIASRLIESEIGKYDWVAMSSGLGHLYMNQQKTLFNIYST